MTVVSEAEFRAALGRQALGRSLSTSEHEFAAALEAIFSSGEHDLAKVAGLLQAKGVQRPLEVLGQ